MTTSRAPSRTAAAGFLAAGGAAALFGTSAVTAELYAARLDPVSVAVWRLVIGGTALAAVASWRGGGLWRTAPVPLLVGSLTVIGFQVCYFAAVARLGVGQATVLTIALGPLVAALVDHRRRVAALTWRWAGGAALAAGGVVMLGRGTWTLDVLGVAFAVLAGCGFPIYGNVLRLLSADRDGLTAAAGVFGAAAPMAFVLLLTPYAQAPTSAELGALLYLGLGPTALAYLLWTWGLRRLTVRDTVLITMLEPVTAVALATFVLGDSLGALAALGMLAVVGGVLVTSLAGAMRAPQRGLDGCR